MKDKRLTYILLPLVVVLWVVIGHRFYKAVKGDNVTSVSVLPETIAIEEEGTIPYEWQLNYADPFLKNTLSSGSLGMQETTSKRLVKLSTTERDIPLPAEWNKLKYLGMIRNNNTDKQIGIIMFQDTRKLVRVGDHIAGFVIEQIQKDSIRVRCAQQKKYVVRQGRIEWLSQHE